MTETEWSAWAQYLYLDRPQWPTKAMMRGIPPRARLVEHMAEEIAQTWVATP